MKKPDRDVERIIEWVCEGLWDLAGLRRRIKALLRKRAQAAANEAYDLIACRGFGPPLGDHVSEAVRDAVLGRNDG